MTDALKLLAYVANLQSQDSSDGLKKVADEQRDSIEKKKQIRAVQEYDTKITADGSVTFDELQKLHQMRSEIGSTTDSFWNENGRVREFTTGMWKEDDSQENAHGNGHNDTFSLSLNNTDDATDRQNKAKMDGLKREVDTKMDNTTDDAQALQFTIQTSTSDMQNAQSTASQAEKRVDDLRNEMRKNWAS